MIVASQSLRCVRRWHDNKLRAAAAANLWHAFVNSIHFEDKIAAMVVNSYVGVVHYPTEPVLTLVLEVAKTSCET